MSFHNFFFSDKGSFRTAVGALGKMFAEAAFTAVFLYTTELYPTVMRSVSYRILSLDYLHSQTASIQRTCIEEPSVLKHLDYSTPRSGLDPMDSNSESCVSDCYRNVFLVTQAKRTGLLLLYGPYRRGFVSLDHSSWRSMGSFTKYCFHPDCFCWRAVSFPP